MVNVDMNAVQQLSAFFDFVSNPAKYADMVAQLKAASADLQDKLGAQATLAAAQKVKDAADSALEDAQAAAADIVAKAEEDAQRRVTFVAQREQAVAERETTLNMQKSVQDGVQNEILSQQSALVNKVAELAKKEADLNAQIDANNKVAADFAARLALIKQAGG